MIYVGIDVSKDKHDCTIVSSDGKILADVFTIQNNLDGFQLLFQRIKSVAPDLSQVKVGLEATGHYSYNILGFLLDKGLSTPMSLTRSTPICSVNQPVFAGLKQTVSMRVSLYL